MMGMTLKEFIWIVIGGVCLVVFWHHAEADDKAVYDASGQFLYRVSDGNIYGRDGQYRGRVEEDGDIYGRDNTYEGNYSNDHFKKPDGTVDYYNRDGYVYDRSGKFIGRVEED